MSDDGGHDEDDEREQPVQAVNEAADLLTASSSGGSRKICTVPTTKSEKQKPIHSSCAGQAPKRRQEDEQLGRGG